MGNNKSVRRDTETLIKTLRLFNEKADLLRTRSYVKQAGDQQWTVHVDNVTKQTIFHDIRPEVEAREALLLTLRFFYKELKFKAIVEIYKQLQISDDQKAAVIESFEDFHRQIKTHSGVMVQIDGRAFTSEDIFTSFMFGQYCHAEGPLIENLKLFAKNPLMSMLINHEFDALICML